MKTIRSDLLPPPPILKDHVECFSLTHYTGDQGLAIKVAPKAVPGLVFQHHNGRSALHSVATPSGMISAAPTLFLYGPGIEPSVMRFTGGPYTSIQVVLKPHALSALLGINASVLAGGFMELTELSPASLNKQLLNARDEQQQVMLLARFLTAQLRRERSRDMLIEESLKWIHDNPGGVNVRGLVERLNISERQFERRFTQTVGVAPQSYIRVKRFNEAVRLIKSRQHRKLTDVAYALNYYDQSHLIHDIRTLSGVTPGDIARNVEGVYYDEVGYSYF